MPAPKAKVALVCEGCGKVVMRVPSEAIPGKNKFCSRSCHSRAIVAARTTNRDQTALFMAKVLVSDEPNACWLWVGSCNSDGYGHTGRDHKTYLTHRWAYKYWRGPIPAGLQVLHKCDVRNCCNPDHLFLGTHKDNMMDMAKKMRGAAQLGKYNNQAKLTEVDVLAIRAAHQSGENMKDVAKAHSICLAHCLQVALGKKWKHVEMAASIKVGEAA